MRSPIFQGLRPIMGETITRAALFETRRECGAFVSLAIRDSQARGLRYFFREYCPINSPWATM